MVLTTLSAGAAFVVLMLSWPPLAVAHRFIGETYKNHKGEVFKALDIVDYEQFYYYHSIHGKMAESLSVSQCTIGGGIKDWDGYSPTRGHDADIEVNMHPPGKIVFNQWRSLKYALSETPTKHATQRQFVQVSPSLCISKEFKYYSNGNFKRAKGCLKMVTKDKNTGRETKVVNTYGATLHPDHARCNHEAAVKTCVTSTKHATDYPVEIENETPIANEAYPFLLTAKDVIVAKSGMFALPCGPVGLYSSCEATNWGLPSARNHTADAARCRHADETHGEHMTEQAGALKGALHLEDCPHTVYEKVFAMCQYDDTQIGQFVLEALPKLVYHLDMLYANPDMKIHYGFTKRAVLPSFVLPHTIFQWLGLSDRLINGTFYAKEAYMPREGGCQEPGYNMWEIYHMRETFKNRAIKEIGTGGRNNSAGWAFPTAASFDGKVAGGETDLGPMDYQSNEGDVDKPVVILVKRGASKFTQNQGDHKIRRWPPELGGAAAVRDALAEQFPDHNIQIFSDSDFEMMMCHACAVQLFQRAEVVVGIHGAGLTNCIYMKPGGVVIEGIPQYDSRHAPITGIFPRLSGMMGLNHYSYDMKDDFHPLKIAQDTRTFYDQVQAGQPRIMPHEISGHHEHSHDQHTHTRD